MRSTLFSFPSLFFPLHDRLNPPNAILNVYRASDDTWFLIVLTPDKWPALAKGIGRPDLLTDPRFTDPSKQIVYLRADERVPFGAFASVMDAVKQAGITNVSIVTQPLTNAPGQK